MSLAVGVRVSSVVASKVSVEIAEIAVHLGAA